MDQRLVRVLGSFITRSSDYALARLEYAINVPHGCAPPIIERLPDASERTLRERWDRIEAQLHNALEFVRETDGDDDPAGRSDPAFLWLKRTTRELDQYARALRWVLTVTEADPTEEAAD